MVKRLVCDGPVRMVRTTIRFEGTSGRVRLLGLGLLLLSGGFWMPAAVCAGTIETAILERPWPRQWVKESEVYKYTVRWRQRFTKQEGLFTGVSYTVPTDRQTTWKLATDYSAVGKLTPGVTAVRYLEDTPNRQVIQIDVKVLWKNLQLNFEIERDPPDALRFRLVNEFLGEYRGVMLLKEPTQDLHSSEPATTLVEMSTWLQPAAPVPLGMLAVVQRMIFLKGAKEFLQLSEHTYLETITQDE